MSEVSSIVESTTSNEDDNVISLTQGLEAIQYAFGESKQTWEKIIRELYLVLYNEPGDFVPYNKDTALTLMDEAFLRESEKDDEICIDMDKFVAALKKLRQGFYVALGWYIVNKRFFHPTEKNIIGSLGECLVSQPEKGVADRKNFRKSLHQLLYVETHVRNEEDLKRILDDTTIKPQTAASYLFIYLTIVNVSPVSFDWSVKLSKETPKLREHKLHLKEAFIGMYSGISTQAMKLFNFNKVLKSTMMNPGQASWTMPPTIQNIKDGEDFFFARYGFTSVGEPKFQLTARNANRVELSTDDSENVVLTVKIIADKKRRWSVKQTQQHLAGLGLRVTSAA